MIWQNSPVIYVIKSIAVVSFVFIILPMIAIVPLSVSNSYYLKLEGFTWHWYESVITSSGWLEAALSSVSIATLTAFLCIALSLPAAEGINRLSEITQVPLLHFLLIPLMTPVVIYAAAVYIWFSKLHFLDNALVIILSHTVLALPVSILVLFVSITRFRKMYRDIETAAKSMGASYFYTLFYVLIPNIRGGLIMAFALSFAISFNEAVIVQFLSDTNIKPLSKKIFEGIKFEINPELAAISCLLILLSVIGLALVKYFLYLFNHKPTETLSNNL